VVRAQLLNRLIASLNSSDSADDVLELALETVERGARCDRSAILLFDELGQMRFRAHHGLSDAYRAAVEGHSPWTIDSVDAAPVAVTDTELDDAWASFRPVFRRENIRAIAFVPLVHRHRLIGKVMLYREEPSEFTEQDLGLATTAAHHVALAVERTAQQQALSRALMVERAAHAAADRSTKSREDIISVVSHDLRNPLGAILMASSALLHPDIDRNRVRALAERVHRQAERMARQLDDLVDFAAIESGRIALARAVHPPSTILDAATDMFAAVANEQGLHFETRATANLPPIECDSERAVQVMANLVSNAMKVTPRGGALTIGATKQSDAEVVFFVKDTGPGIAKEDQPKLFEKFWRGGTYRGAGLGLSIARGIVDAHGGKIWVESELGRGSTFYFSLTT
jgi:signal transduction histidine kinase